MIELRWLKKRKIKSGMVSTSKVLQYREGGSYPDRGPEDRVWIGTEWKDVPIVSDDDIGESR